MNWEDRPAALLGRSKHECAQKWFNFKPDWIFRNPNAVAERAVAIAAFQAARRPTCFLVAALDINFNEVWIAKCDLQSQFIFQVSIIQTQTATLAVSNTHVCAH